MRLNPDTYIAEIHPRRAFALDVRGLRYPQTYLDIAARFDSRGISFEPWQNQVFMTKVDRLSSLWREWSDLRKQLLFEETENYKPFPEIFGSGVLPATTQYILAGIAFGPFVIGNTGEGLRQHIESYFAPEDDWVKLDAIGGIINAALAIWWANGMFQVSVCLTLLNCFNLDHRGRPKKVDI